MSLRWADLGTWAWGHFGRRGRAEAHATLLPAVGSLFSTKRRDAPPSPSHTSPPPFPLPVVRSVMVAKGALPGSNGSDARANAAAAGLIIIFIGG